MNNLFTFKKLALILILFFCCYLLFIYKNKVNIIPYKILKTYPHDKTTFTEGLIFEKNQLYESSGLYKNSKLINTKLKPPHSQKIRKLPNRYFGEGITIIGKYLYQLTYKSQKGFVYNKNILKFEKTFPLGFEGWGLTTDKKNLIASDGSNFLHVINPKTFKEIRIINVTYKKHPIFNINELEYVNGKIFANIWQTPLIAIIDYKTGKINFWINIKKIIQQEKIQNPESGVANGIAYNLKNHTLFITGKYWSKVYEIKLLKYKI